MPASEPFSLHDRLMAQVEAGRDALVDTTRRLVRIASPNPPGDVTTIAQTAAALLETIPGMVVRRYESAPASSIWWASSPPAAPAGASY